MAEEIIGDVVGPVSSSISGGAAERYIRDGAQYDFAIGGLPFANAISDERPYARETASFKKDQVDQSATVGDQSLTGYWTRGQASFHRGAGITYYEILEGDTITNRYTDSLSVDPWTPGELTLKSALENVSATPVADGVQHDGKILTLSPAGAANLVTYAGSATSKPSVSAGAFSSIASDGVNGYGTDADKIEQIVASGSFATLWTHHVGGRTWSKVWWAKDRLWAVDNTGEWYTLSTVGGVTSGADILWTSGKGGTGWSLSDGEGGVFIAHGNTVFLSTLDTSTTTPTLVVPVSVASVGAQETIAALGAYLGYLIVCSDAGARMGQIQSNGVVLGNIIVDSDFTDCSRASFRKNLVLATGSGFLYEFNVLEQVSDLQAAYAPVRTTPSSGATGSLVLADGRVVTWGTDGLNVESADLADSGFVQTGYHRFGTLEPKDFRTLTVRASGTAGSIAVEKVLRDGTVVSLLTLGVESFYNNEIPLNLGAPTDFIGLRFTLISDGDVAPTLLGYQLRALPAPKRQRLIQVPVMCMDYERIGSTTYGHDGWAWERLSALEEMEENSSVVVYQDFRVGETAKVSIESIQHQGKTPSSRGSDNFGGFIVITLRKVV